jgi:CHAT domain-containing protein
VVLQQAYERGDSALAARALTWLGLAAYRKGNYDTARAEGEAALALKIRLNLTTELFRSYNALGLLAWNQGRLHAAESLFAAAGSAAEAVNDQDGAGRSAGNLGLVLVEFGDYAAARVGLTAMGDAGRAEGQTRVEANALANLAMLDIREGNPLAAVGRLRAARELYALDEYAPGQANALGQLATAHRDMGDYPSALAAVDSAIAITRRHEMRQEEAANLEVLATLHAQTGNDGEALRVLREARFIDSALGLRVEVGSNLRTESEIHLGAGERLAAVLGAKEALRLHEDAGAHVERLSDLLLLAEADTAHGEQWLRAARALADSLQLKRARADIALTAARIGARRRDWRGMLSVLAAASFDTATAPMVQRWELADLMATALGALGRRLPAEREARRAVDFLERVRGDLPGPWSRTRFVASRAGSFAHLVEILVEQGRNDEAFAVSDASRGRALLEHLASLDSTDLGRDEVLGGLAEQDRLLRRIGALSARLDEIERDDASDAATVRARVSAALSEARREFERRFRGVRVAGRGATLLGAGGTSVSQVQSALRADEALVEYLIGPERIHLFLVTRDGLAHWPLPATPEDVGSRVRIARDQSARPGAAENSWPVLATLHSQLLATVRDAGALAGVRRLIIVPHGVLSTLPFAALRDARTDRFLVEDYALQTMPSAAALVALRRGPRQADSTRRDKVAAFAPFPDQLPGSRIETRGIEQAIGGVRSWVGAQATEATLRASSGDAGILHLATHGRLNPDNPLFSRIDLRGAAGGPSASDGRLEVHEVLGLRIRSGLVYLSGCETALGGSAGNAFMRGEEYATLAQAFMYAGARSVIATLWRIPDQGSAPLVAGFYRNVGRMSLADALAEAQRTLLRDPAHAHPYYWAGHVLSGDGGT